MCYLYILKCADQTLYTGVAKELERRVDEHNSAGLGAKYTRGRLPIKLLWHKSNLSESEARKEEYRIKNMSRNKKEMFIKSNKN